jgi:hypothetical protein
VRSAAYKTDFQGKLGSRLKQKVGLSKRMKRKKEETLKNQGIEHEGKAEMDRLL